MDKQRIQAYLDLIQALLCASDQQQTEILQANLYLIDQGLVQVMKVVVAQIAKEKDRETWEWLEGFAAQLAEAIHSWYELSEKAVKLARQGKYAEAVTYAEQALNVAQKLQGDEHPYMASSLNNLAGLYQRQGRFTEAEPLYLEALHMRKRLFGEEHSDVASSLNSLAGLYQRQGRFTEAEPLYLEALHMRKRLFGKEHPDVASSLNSLAGLYQRQGRFTEAEPLYLEALHMRKRLFGKEHSDVASSLNSLAGLYQRQGRFTEAEPLHVEELQMSKRLLGDEHPDVATSLNNLAELYKSQGHFAEAEPLLIESLQMRKRLLGKEHPDVASSLNNLGVLYQRQGRFVESEPLHVEALQMTKRLLGEEHPDVAYSLNNLAALYESQGRFAEAETFYNEALQMWKHLLGNEHTNVASSLNNLATLYRSQGLFSKAKPLYIEVLQMWKRLLGDEHTNVASSLNNLAALYESQGRFTEAKPLYLEALEMRKRLLGEEHPDVAGSLNNLALLYESQGRLTEAEPLHVEALQMRKRLLGDQHPDVASSLNNLAALYRSQGRFSEAEPLYNEALQMRKRLLGEEHLYVADSLNNLAGLYENQGRFTEAEPLYNKALQMRKRLLGEEHPHVASSLNNLAVLYKSQGRFTEAEPLYIEALQMRKRLLSEEHPEVAGSLNNLAGLYENQGRFTEAEPLHVEALQMTKRLLGEEHPDVATSLNNLAGLYESQGRFTEVEPLYNEALQMWKRLLGDEHPSVAISLNNLAGLYKSQGRFTEAEPLYNEALQMKKRLLGDEHPDVAISLNDLALLYQSQGGFTEANILYNEALQMRIIWGKEHPDVASILNNLAVLLVHTGSYVEALARMTEATQVEDNILRRTFAFSSEKDRLTYLQSIRKNFEIFISLVLSYLQDSPEAVQTALDLVLRRKALTASALAAQNQAFYSGRYPHLTAEFKQLRRLSEEIVYLTFAISEGGELSRIRETIKQKQIEYDNLQRQLAKEVPEIKLQEPPTDRRAVALELPEGSTLVEFVCTRIFDFTAPEREKWQSAHYLAFILPAQQPDAVQLIDLGEAKHINRLIRVFRQEASRESNNSEYSETQPTATNLGKRLEMTWDLTSESDNSIVKYKLLAEAIQLREAIFDKISPYLKNSKHLILAPDGELNILPFQLLPLEGERMLMDSYSISYLSVGRDILRAKISTMRPASSPVVIADPNFDLKPSGWVERSETQQPVSNVDVGFRSSISFDRASGTRFLGESVAKMLGVQPYLDKEALESHLTIDNCPSILLIATHGYFSHGKGRQDYVNLVIALLNCPNNKEREELLRKNRSLLDEDLVLLMKQLASLYEENGDREGAHLLRDFAAQIPEIVAALPTQPRDNRLSAPVEDPMLRSGLALAGANRWLSGEKLPKEAGKGFLFAQEVAGLDLWANELTVLSACQTGMGDIQLGEGVFGLRRAFAVAGTRTLIMSLWSVPDRVTALLIERMFADLKEGKGRGSALQSAQNYIRRITVGELRQTELGLEVLKEQMGVVELKSDAKLPWDDNVRLLEHPYYWGAWVCQGETKPMS